MKQNRTIHKLLMPLIVSLLIGTLGGCANYPQVAYLPVSSDKAQGAIKFSLQGSQVTLSTIKDDKGKLKATDKNAQKIEIELSENTISNINDFKEKKVQAIVTATESNNHFYAIKPHESMWKETNVSVSFVDNTKLIKSIGTSFKDKRIEVIEKAGSIITSIIPLVGILSTGPVVEEELKLPVVIDLSEISDKSSSSWSRIPGHNQWWYKLNLKDLPESVSNSSDFFKANFEKNMRAMVYSSCQDAGLLITSSKEKPESNVDNFVTFKIRIANPNYIDTINFPVKGRIAMHSICGADIKTEDSDDISNLAVTEALIKQIAAIKKAQKD